MIILLFPQSMKLLQKKLDTDSAPMLPVSTLLPDHCLLKINTSVLDDFFTLSTQHIKLFLMCCVALPGLDTLI